MLTENGLNHLKIIQLLNLDMIQIVKHIGDGYQYVFDMIKRQNIAED